MAKKKQSQHVDVPAQAQVEEDSALERLVEWVNSADEMTKDARAISEKCKDYYDGAQLTPGEIAELKKRKQAPVAINRIKPKIDSMMGMEKAAKTTAKAFPRTPQHEKAAEAASESIRFVLGDNDFPQIRSSCWEHMAIEGTGGCEIIVKPTKKDGFRVTLNPIMWDRIIIDPHARRKDCKDARFLGQVVWQDYDEALAEHPKAKDVLDALIDGSQTYADKPAWVDGKRRRVKIVELYYLNEGDWYYACFTAGGFIKAPMRSPYKNEEGESEHAYEFQSAFIDREGGRYGAVRQLLDVQDEINKRRSKALHLMSVRQVRWERGAVADINEARRELAKPDGVIETTPGMEFEVLKTGDMAAAQFNLLTEAKMEIDQVGMNAATQGKDKTVQSGVALRERQSAGQSEIGPMFDGLRYWQQRVFRKVYNRVRQYWKEETWIRVTDDEQSLRWVGLNHPVTKGEQMLKAAQQQGIPPEQLAAMQAQVETDPMMKEVVETENELAKLDVDIIVSEVPDVLTQSIEDWTTMGEMIKSGFPIPPLAAIEASPFASSTKEKMIKQMKESPQIPPEMQKQMQQLQEQAQKLTEENQTLKSGQQEAQMKMQTEGQIAQMKSAAQRDQAQADFALKKMLQDQEIQLERARAEATIQLERQKAQAMLELEAVKIAANADADIDGAIMKIKGLITQHEAKIKAQADTEAAVKEAGDKAVEKKADGESSAALQSIGKQIIAALQAKKTVTAQIGDRTMTATVGAVH